MGDVWFQNNGTTAAVTSLTPDQVSALSTAAIASLTPDQINVLSTAAIASLSAAQVHVLSTADVASLTPNQVQALSTASLSGLSADQLHALSTVDISALSAGQVHALSTAQIHDLSANQVAALTSVDISSLSIGQVKALTVDDIAALHDLGKTDNLTTPQVQAIMKPHYVNSELDDVLFSGNVTVHTNAVAGTDQIQLVVSGSAHEGVELVGQHGDWKDAGSLLVNGAEGHAYTNGHTEIVIQGSVTTTVKDVLIG